MPVFKFATDEHIPQLKELILEYCKENNLEAKDANVDHYLGTFFKLGKTLVAFEDDAMVGVICYAVMPHHFTGDLIFKKLCWYVTPKYRKGLGLQLLSIAEEDAKVDGALVSFVAVHHTMKMPSDYMPYETEYIKIL